MASDDPTARERPMSFRDELRNDIGRSCALCQRASLPFELKRLQPLLHLPALPGRLYASRDHGCKRCCCGDDRKAQDRIRNAPANGLCHATSRDARCNGFHERHVLSGCRGDLVICEGHPKQVSFLLAQLRQHTCVRSGSPTREAFALHTPVRLHPVQELFTFSDRM